MSEPATTSNSDSHKSTESATPRNSHQSKSGDEAPSTPAGRRAMAPGTTPKSAPQQRPRAISRKAEPPTLLTDFLMGRPSPARIAAERQRRQSVEAVKAELRQEMRSGAVRKLQPPGGVRDRVKAWQKTNAAVVINNALDDAATEPTELAFKDEEIESVTEEDRVRIKMRQKRRASKPSHHAPSKSTGNIPNIEEMIANEQPRPVSISPPKKRVVSDHNWMKDRPRKSPPRKVSPLSKRSSSPKRLPKDFVLRSQNPLVSDKVKEWATLVQQPAEPQIRKHRPSKSCDSRLQVTERASKSRNDVELGRQAKDKHTDDNDGIRVRPFPEPSNEERRKERQAAREARRRGTSTASRRDRSDEDRIVVIEDGSDLTQTDHSTELTQTELSAEMSTEMTNSYLETPTRRRASRTKAAQDSRKLKVEPCDLRNRSDVTSTVMDEHSAVDGSDLPISDMASNLTAKSLADIPGDIPFGHSAFTELDLPLNGPAKSRPKRTKVDRSTSFKGVPGVFKKVVEEGKKMINEMNETPRPQGPNKPPSIEKWLNTTVDPFVDSQPTSEESDKKKSEEPDTPTEQKTRSPQGTRKHSLTNSRLESEITDESTELTQSTTFSTPNDEPKTPEAQKEQPADKSSTKTPTSSGLKRSRATRNTSSPLKATGKRAFLGMLKEAFQGESSGHVTPPKVYQSQEERRYVGDDFESTVLSESVLSGSTEDDFRLDEEGRRDSMVPAPLSLAAPRLRPPTSGNHELSTIMSESSSALGSDLSSAASHSTLTQSTVLTNDSEPARDLPAGGGLKRRLTKHADLVSVLSLPDDGQVPEGVKSRRSRPSQRKTRNKGESIGLDELLQEFADDEGLYGRELKTLADGVVPVLLTQVVDRGDVSQFFSPNSPGHKSDAISKSVVGMGIALEKLKTAHKKAPLNDIRRLSHWANGVVPIYHSYLGSWRLGFQDLFINLAPRNEADEDDSLIGALPQNAKGDIVNSQGERVDVAYLLKRPLIRLKQMTKFLQCVDSMMPSSETMQLLREFEELQEKARRRHREETARLADEEAASTDTTRCRDIRTLAAIDMVSVDPLRQVNAKDLFTLDLAHSNGQRMECQVELVHRDRPNHPEDPGDLLVRETGDSRRSYLLFPPINMTEVSARTGEGNFDMVIMIRGTDAGRPWHELLTLTADDEDQILDWLDILPISPVPPREPEPSLVGEPDEEHIVSSRLPEAPVGVRGFRTPSSEKQPRARSASQNPTTTPTKQPLPARYHPREANTPSTPLQDTRTDLNRHEKTPTQDDYRRRQLADSTRPLSESMRPDPATLEPLVGQPPAYRDDGAPPPPAHRAVSPSQESRSKPSTPRTSAAESRKAARIKRRTSSPLKHEYTPSDQSASDLSTTDESDAESSDDEIESVDIPDTELGLSLQKPSAPALTSVLSASDCSLTPSNSASQAGLRGPKITEDNAARFLAAVSRWSDKGAWKDLFPQTCSIIVTAGLVEVYTFNTTDNAAATPRGGALAVDQKPLLALDLTPLVLCRQSTTVDLEIRSSVQSHCRLAQTYAGGNFRFRCHTGPDCFNLYMAVHHARLQNQKFIELENEARFKSFGERKPTNGNDGDSSSRRRSWFGRKNSYRGSVRAPAQSVDGTSNTPSSSLSASSFLKRLTVAGNLSFNLARSSVDRQGRPGSGPGSLYTSGSSSASGTPPRSPSISLGQSGLPMTPGTENLRIRLHLLVTGNKWEDMGNCSLTISRPPPGWRQALRADHGMEKRVTVNTLPRKDSEKPTTKLDAVLGSGCFSMLGTRGIVCGIWEEVKDADGVVGMVPANGATGGNVQRWCFQFASAGEAHWVLRLVHQEVERS